MIVRKPIAALSVLVLLTTQLTAQLQPGQLPGKDIYLSGKSPSGGKIIARIDGEGTSVAGAILPCGGCHGSDGLGRPEGGINPPDITWDALTVSRRPPYDDATLKRAITLGIDPTGNPIGNVMPRYQMSIADMNNLLAYLHVLGKEIDPGISDSELRIGVLLPAGNRVTEMKAAIREALQSFALDVNEKGGVFGRILVLRFFEPEGGAAERVAGIAAFLSRENVFALIASFLYGAEQQIAALVNERQIPLIGALSLYTRTSRDPNNYVFYLLAGLAEQAESLAVAAARGRNAPANAAIVLSAEELTELAGDAIEEQCIRLGWKAPIRIRLSSPPAIAKALREHQPEVVFVLEPGVLTPLIAADSQVRSKPLYLVPSSLAGVEPPDIPSQARDRVLFSFPVLPSDNSPAGLNLFRRLVVESSANSRHVAAQWAALSSGSLLLAALNSAGRNLSRGRVIAGLETLHRFDTGLLPPATFGRNRRVASIGAHVMPAGNPAESKWIEPR